MIRSGVPTRKSTDLLAVEAHSSSSSPVHWAANASVSTLSAIVRLIARAP